MEDHTRYTAWLAQEAARRSDTLPTRPLDLLVLGAAVALGTLAGVLALAYKTWYLHEIPENTAILISGFLFFVYAGGVYIFCYAWERGDVARAVRITAIIVVLSAAAVLIAAIVLGLLSKARGLVSSGKEGADDSVSGINLAVPLRVLGSYVDDGRIGLDDLKDGSEGASDESDLLTITCWQCRQPFIPIPPKAACPNCGWSAVTVA